MSEAISSAVPVQPVDAVFVGTFCHALDPKRRFTIPSEWRERGKEDGRLYVLPRVKVPCLVVFTEKELFVRLANVGHFSIVDDKARLFHRALGSRSALVTWDTQGRVRIRDDLLNEAHITDRVALVGNIRYFEVWKPEEYEKSASMTMDTFVDALQHVGF